MGCNGAVVLMALNALHQVWSLTGNTFEALPCTVFIGENCTLTIRSLADDSIRANKLTWTTGTNKTILIFAGEQANPEVIYGAGYDNGHYSLNTNDGLTLTIHNVTLDDTQTLCFRGNFSTLREPGAIGCNCTTPWIQVPIDEILMFDLASLTPSATLGSSKFEPKPLNVVAGVPVLLNCSIGNYVRPTADFKWSVGGLELAGESSACEEFETGPVWLLGCYSLLNFTPEWSHDLQEMSCNASNRGFSRGGVAVSVQLNMNVTVQASGLFISDIKRVYQAGDWLEVQKGELVTVNCTATETRPAAYISWSIGDTHMNSGFVEATPTGELYNTTAQLDFIPMQSMHKEMLVCAARTPDMVEDVSVSVVLIVDDDATSVTVIVCVLGVAGCIILILVIWIVIKKRRQMQREPKGNLELHSTGSYPDTGSGKSSYATQPVVQPYPRDRLNLVKVLGHGNFSSVHLASAVDILTSGGKTYVALKTLKEGAGKDAKKCLLREVDMMKKLGCHPNVVRYLGNCLEKEPLYVIIEYMSNGNLKDYLRQNRPQDYTYIDTLDESLNGTDLLKFARDIAKGMEFLSSNNCIHCDLAARNVFIAGDKTCKISDFGLARDVGNSQVSQKPTKVALPLRWMALESIDKDIYSQKSDVWSFGIVLWEIVTFGARPFPNMEVRGVISQIRGGYRMPKPNNCDEMLYGMMLACWDADPDRRPSFTELLATLETLLEKEADYITIGLYEETMYLTPGSCGSQDREKI